MLYTAHLPSPLGGIVLASDGEALCGLWFEGQKHFPALPEAEEKPELAVFEKTRAWLAGYFAGETAAPDLPLRPAGTAFQRGVWELLLQIPRGETRSYGELAAAYAERSGKPCAARAVGAAVGRNPISILVPCHRVIGADGSLRGYAGGLARKRKLLEGEGIRL